MRRGTGRLVKVVYDDGDEEKRVAGELCEAATAACYGLRPAPPRREPLPPRPAARASPQKCRLAKRDYSCTSAES